MLGLVRGSTSRRLVLSAVYQLTQASSLDRHTRISKAQCLQVLVNRKSEGQQLHPNNVHGRKTMEQLASNLNVPIAILLVQSPLLLLIQRRSGSTRWGRASSGRQAPDG